MLSLKLEEKEKLEGIHRTLRQYCHNKNCRLTHACPKTHPKCSKELGLDTAIAWRIADMIITRIFCCYPTKLGLNEPITEVEMIKMILRIHNNPKTDPLLDILYELSAVLKNIKRRINNED